MAVDKDAGLVVHPAPGHPSGTLINALLHRYREAPPVRAEPPEPALSEKPPEGSLLPLPDLFGDGTRPGVVHRLDRYTTGVILAARSLRAQQALALALALTLTLTLALTLTLTLTLALTLTLSLTLTLTLRRPWWRLSPSAACGSATSQCARACRLRAPWWTHPSNPNPNPNPDPDPNPNPNPNPDQVDAPIGRHPTNRLKMARLRPPCLHASAPRPPLHASTPSTPPPSTPPIPPPSTPSTLPPLPPAYPLLQAVAAEGEGREATSFVHTLGHDGRRAVVAVLIRTGRTHQVRVHMQHLRHPLLGDPVYGDANWNRLEAKRATRPMLHAHQLRLKHPMPEHSDKLLCLTAPPPDDLTALVAEVVGCEATPAAVGEWLETKVGSELAYSLESFKY